MPKMTILAALCVLTTSAYALDDFKERYGYGNWDSGGRFRGNDAAPVIRAPLDPDKRRPTRDDLRSPCWVIAPDGKSARNVCLAPPPSPSRRAR
jgi:hypothetical protein